MTESDDKHTDSELKPYLEGRDGVSAAYRKSGREEPPAMLDHAILQAARAAVKPVVAMPIVAERTQSNSPLESTQRSWREPYALAASLMVGVLGASIYFSQNDLPVSAPTEQKSEAAPALAPLQPPVVLLPAPAIQQEVPSADTADNLQQPRENFVERRLPEPQSTVPSTENPAVTPAARNADSTQSAALQAPPPVPVVIAGPMLEAIEAAAAAEQAKAAVTASEEARSARDAGQSAAQRVGFTNEVATEPANEPANERQLEEIQVTGSRIRRDDFRDVSYRDSQEAWLNELHDIVDDLARVDETAPAGRGRYLQLNERLEEESELFSEEYPDVDLEAELASPRR